jgi:hypothetical protein
MARIMPPTMASAPTSASRKVTIFNGFRIIQLLRSHSIIAELLAVLGVLSFSETTG